MLKLLIELIGVIDQNDVLSEIIDFFGIFTIFILILNIL